MSDAEAGSGRATAGELGSRLLVAGAGIPLGVLLVYLGGWWLGILLAAVSAGGARELFGLARIRGPDPITGLGVPAAALLVLAATASPGFQAFALFSWGLVLVLTLASLVAVVWLRGPAGGPLPAASITVAGALYTGGGLSFAMLIRSLPESGSADPPGDPWAGPVLLLLVLVVTWMGDTCAYFVGKRWGRRKLVPRISPAKTIVGGVAGLAGSLGAAVAFAFLLEGQLRPFGIGFSGAVLLGLILGAGAQLGDLAESVLKREAGVKDSGSLLPGHGGILDRFDALFLNLPLAYGLICLLGALA